MSSTMLLCLHSLCYLLCSTVSSLQFRPDLRNLPSAQRRVPVRNREAHNEVTLHVPPQNRTNSSAHSSLIQSWVNKHTKNCICCMFILNARHCLYFTQRTKCETSSPLRKLHSISHETDSFGETSSSSPLHQCVVLPSKKGVIHSRVRILLRPSFVWDGKFSTAVLHTKCLHPWHLPLFGDTPRCVPRDAQRYGKHWNSSVLWRHILGNATPRVLRVSLLTSGIL